MNEEVKVTPEPIVETVVEPVVKEVVETKTPTELKRELSKELGINLFDVNAEEFAKFKEYQENQKTEQEKLTEQVNSFKEKEIKFNTETEKLNAEIVGLKLGIPTDKLDDALALAKNNMSDGQTIEDGLKAIQAKYKDMFVKAPGVTLEVGTQMRNSEANSNTPPDPALARYLAKQKKK
jgi:molecular chaperone GrpE (heat shock protein)